MSAETLTSASGGGESFAALFEASVAAADELRDRTGASRVSLVGLRLGAVHAWRASRARRDVDKLVLWEPVVHGGAYLADLQRRHEDFLHEELPNRRRPPSKAEALGFPLVPALRAELMGLDLAAEADPAARAIHALIAHETDDERRLARRLEERAPRSTYANLSLARDWNSEEAVNSSLVPAAALEAIVASMEAR